MVSASSIWAVLAIIFSVLNRKWGFIWFFSICSRTSSSCFSILCFSVRASIYPLVLAFMVQKALTRLAISSLPSAQVSGPVKSFSPIRLESSASSTMGRTMFFCTERFSHLTIKRAAAPHKILTAGTIMNSGRCISYRSLPDCTVICSRRPAWVARYP